MDPLWVSQRLFVLARLCSVGKKLIAMILVKMMMVYIESLVTGPAAALKFCAVYSLLLQQDLCISHCTDGNTEA